MMLMIVTIVVRFKEKSTQLVNSQELTSRRGGNVFPLKLSSQLSTESGCKQNHSLNSVHTYKHTQLS